MAIFYDINNLCGGYQNSIKKSEFVICFLRKERYETRFCLRYSKRLSKPLFFINFIKPKNNLSCNRVILNVDYLKVYENINSDMNTEVLKRFKVLISNFFNLSNIYTDKSEVKLVEIFKTQKSSMNYKYELISSNNEILINTKEGVLQARNLKTGELIGQLVNGVKFDFHWIEHLKKILILFNNSTQWAELYEKIGTFDSLAFGNSPGIEVQKFFYNKITEQSYIVTPRKIVYLMNHTFKELSRINMGKIYNLDVSTYFVFKWLRKTLTIYTPSFTFLCKIETSDVIQSVVSDESIRDYFFLKTDSEIIVCETRYFKQIGLIKVPIELNTIINRKLIFSDLSEVSFVYKIEWPKRTNDSKYVCKLKPNKEHVLLNSYLLPCNHSACLDCIYDNISIYLRRIECFCSKDLNFNCEIRQNTEIEEQMKGDSDKILNQMMKNGNDLVNKMSKTLLYCANNYLAFKLLGIFTFNIKSIKITLTFNNSV